MAVTIVRTNWIDDDGSGTTGTVLNNAIKTELYNQIDGALAQLVASNGLLNITAFGVHQIVAGGTGTNTLLVQNTQAGTGNYSIVAVGNDQTPYAGYLQVSSSTWTTQGPMLTNGVKLEAGRSGGLSLVASDPAAAIRFYTGGTTERMRLTEAGRLGVGTAIVSSVAAQLQVGSDAGALVPIQVMDMNTGAGARNVVNFSQAGSASGSISITATTTAYGTTSDQRLKEDLGIAEDLTALRAVVVHDFVWSAHGGHDRGVFAQETFPVFPRAITVGTPGTDLSKPWMTDYSKFVPDLIVGWQEHDRRLARLESLVNERR